MKAYIASDFLEIDRMRCGGRVLLHLRSATAQRIGMRALAVSTSRIWALVAFNNSRKFAMTTSNAPRRGYQNAAAGKAY